MNSCTLISGHTNEKKKTAYILLNRILSTFAANNLLKAKDEKRTAKKSISSSINRRRLVYLPYQYLFEPQYASAKA